MNKTLYLFTLITWIVLVSCNNNQHNNTTSSNDATALMGPTSNEHHNGQKELKTCIDIVMEMLTTSPAYLQKTKALYENVVKNGGTSFGITIEGSPNPEMDHASDISKTYDFSLHETYADRMPVIARYMFNPNEGKLYEYDVAVDKFISIDFDKNLLLQFNDICK